jgi:chromosome segregation ATPase
MDQLGSAHDKLIEQMKKEAEDALVHEKAMGSGLQAVHEERAVLRAKVDELEKVQTATSADAPARIALLTAELQSSNDELEVVRGELDAAVASLASVTLGRGVARGEVLVARRELAAVEKDMEAMVKQKDGMNRFLESKIVTLERQAEAMRLIPAPAVAPVVRGRGRGRGRGVDT